MTKRPFERDIGTDRSRSWWRSKWWIIVGVLWVGLSYLFSTGPARFAESAGWLSRASTNSYCRPASYVSERLPPLFELYFPYVAWWQRHGKARFVHRTVPLCDSGWQITVYWSEPGFADDGRQPLEVTSECKYWGRGDVTHCRYTHHFVDGHSVVVDNGHKLRKSADGPTKWDGPILWDGEPVAELPAGTRQIEIEYIDGELAVEADGVEIDVDQ